MEKLRKYKYIFVVQFLFFVAMLWQPAAAQTSLPMCTMNIPDIDNDAVAAAVDIDKDNDGLIEICDLEGLNEIRYQLDGSGYATSAEAAKITQGCPVTGCKGYELMRSLDFKANTSYRSVSNKTLWNANVDTKENATNEGWLPNLEARFRGIFEGNGHTISNLYIRREVDSLGLFSVTDNGSEIKNIGLLDVYIKGMNNVGSLAGLNYGAIINSYAIGDIDGARYIGGLVGQNGNEDSGAIINSYATGTVTGAGVGGLAGENLNTITNSYAMADIETAENSFDGGGGLTSRNLISITNSYAATTVAGDKANVGGLVHRVGTFNTAESLASYWDSELSGVAASRGGVAKTTKQLQSPTAARGIYRNWRSSDWDFGDSRHYPTLRYAEGDNLNACETDITTSSTALPCGISLPNQGKGLAGVFFFADDEVMREVLTPPFSQFIYNYDMKIASSDLYMRLRPYASNENTKITVSKGDIQYFSGNRENGALSDPVRLHDNETILNIVVTDPMNDPSAKTTYTFVIVRLFPIGIDISPERVRIVHDPEVTLDPHGPDVVGGGFSYQWQQQDLGGPWVNIAGATTATYWLPADAKGSTRYRMANMTHTDTPGYVTYYPDLGPLRARIDDDRDGLIDIYYLDDIDSMRYQLDGSAYKQNEDAKPIMQGCPDNICIGYEMMGNLDFDVDTNYSYISTSNRMIWTTEAGWQPIGDVDNSFSGIFDGDGYTISNLFIDSSESNIALFSVLHADGDIENIRLSDVDVGGSGNNIGTLVGSSYGLIKSSYVAGDVIGDKNARYLGGLVGYNRGSIVDSHTAVRVSGDARSVGGLVGGNRGSIVNSYTEENVSGVSNIGGLVGDNHGSIVNSYTEGNVTGISNVTIITPGNNIGGLVGENRGSIVNGYTEGSVTGRRGSNIGGLAGLNHNLIINSYTLGSTTGFFSNVGGLVGLNISLITNSYAAGNVTGYSRHIGGLVGRNEHYINNSYATGAVFGGSGDTRYLGGLVGYNNDESTIANSYAIGTVSNGIDIGGFVGSGNGVTTASYWDRGESNVSTSAGGISKTTEELQLPVESTGIYIGWSSDDWDFGNSKQYPMLRYTRGDEAEACITNITTSSTAIPCGISLPEQSSLNRNHGLAGIFYFADGAQAETVLAPLFSQGKYNYNLKIVTSDLKMQLRPYAMNDSAKITITEDNTNHFSGNRKNTDLSDDIELEENETQLTIVITDTMGATTRNTTYTYTIIRLIPIGVDVSPSRLRFFISEHVIDDPHGPPGAEGFSYQWQWRAPRGAWTSARGATTSTYWLPPGADGSIRYRLVDVQHIDGSVPPYTTDYPIQGPYRASVDDDRDGLIDIYTLEDLNEIRYQPDGSGYKPNERAEPNTSGCPEQMCSGYELVGDLDFTTNISYRTISNKRDWQAGIGWLSIGKGTDDFNSVFEGNGYTISNLHINRPKSDLGLFDHLAIGSVIRNIGLLDVNISGTGSFKNHIGGLASDNQGSIINSYVTGIVNGTGNYIGGLVGRNGSLISNSYVTGDIDGADHIGGLVGENDSSIINSYATGVVNGDDIIGGLVGNNRASIKNSYTSAKITTSTEFTGSVGLVGDDSGFITASYWDSTVNPGLMNSLSAKTTSQLQSPTAPGTTATEVYYGWSVNSWDFSDNNHYPALRYVRGGDLNACSTDITPLSTVLPCTVVLSNQSGRKQGLAGVFYFADGKVTPQILTPPLFSQFVDSYDLTILSDHYMQLRPYALNDDAMITVTDQNGNYFDSEQPNRALSDRIEWEGDATTLTIVANDIIDEITYITTYTVVTTRVKTIVVTDIMIDPSDVIDEGSHTTITFTAINGLGNYEYEYVRDEGPLTSLSQPRITFNTPPNVIDSDITTQAVTFKIIVRDEMQEVEHPLALTIRKIDNGSNFNIRTEVSQSWLSVIAEVVTDPDGEGFLSYEWQKLELGGEWTNIAGATTKTYWFPADTNGSSRYRVNVTHTDGQGFINEYQQGPFRIGDLDEDDDGLIEIYYLEDVDAMRHQLSGTGYKMGVFESSRGCPVTGCRGYELARSLDFNNDADYSAISNKMVWTTEASWPPIGSSTDSFSGSFEGNGYIISGLQIDSLSSDIGLFSVLHEDGKIKDVGLLDVNVQGNIDVGGLVGENNGSILNSYAIGTVTGNHNVGGLTGQSRGSISSSFTNIKVSGDSEVGGLVGYSLGDIENTYAAGTVSIITAADQALGGLVGWNQGSITNSYVVSEVMPSINNALRAGGLAGITTGTAAAITASYWDSTVNSNLKVTANARTTIELQTPTAPGTTATDVYYGWSTTHWDFGDSNHYPALRRSTSDDLHACNVDIMIPSISISCAIPLPDQGGRDRGLNAIFFLANDVDVTKQVVPTFFPFRSSYNGFIVTTETEVKLTLRPYAIKDDAIITITDEDRKNYFTDKSSRELSDPITLLDTTTLTLIVTDTINEASVNTTYTFIIRRVLPLTITEVMISPSGTINEGSAATVMFNVSGGTGIDTYKYAYSLAKQPLPSPSKSPFTFTIATDIVDADAIEQTFALQIIVSDDGGQTITHTEDLVISGIMVMGGISIEGQEGQTNEGDTLRLAAPPVSGGSGDYRYEWTQTIEDSEQLSGKSTLTLTDADKDTLEVAIPADFIALAATSTNITFKVVVIDGGFTTSRSKVVTINKINNGSPSIKFDAGSSQLRVSLAEPDVDGEGSFTSLQWQSQVPGGGWTNIAGATMATYSLPEKTGESIRYRASEISYTDAQGYEKDYDPQGPFPGAISTTGDIGGITRVDEGVTFILTAPAVTGGSGNYSYTWTQTAEPGAQLSGKSTLTLTGDSATLEVIIPADFIALAAASAKIIFTVVVDDDFTMISQSKTVTIDKIDNGLADIAVNGTLPITVKEPDPDGNATAPNYEYQWQKRTPGADPKWQDIEAAPAATYSVQDDTLINDFRVVVTYTDGQGYRKMVPLYSPEFIGIRVRTKVFLEGPLR